MGKKSFPVLGKQQDTQIMKFNSHPYTLSLQYDPEILVPKFELPCLPNKEIVYRVTT